jgi:hypothetical protein
MEIGAIEIIFFIVFLICGIAYGYFIGQKEAIERANKLIKPAPYAATGNTTLDAYDKGFRDGVATAKAAMTD